MMWIYFLIATAVFLLPGILTLRWVKKNDSPENHKVIIPFLLGCACMIISGVLAIISGVLALVGV